MKRGANIKEDKPTYRSTRAQSSSAQQKRAQSISSVGEQKRSRSSSSVEEQKQKRDGDTVSNEPWVFGVEPPQNVSKLLSKGELPKLSELRQERIDIKKELERIEMNTTTKNAASAPLAKKMWMTQLKRNEKELALAEKLAAERPKDS